MTQIVPTFTMLPDGSAANDDLLHLSIDRETSRRLYNIYLLPLTIYISENKVISLFNLRARIRTDESDRVL